MGKRFDIDMETVRNLAGLVRRHHLTELTVESDGYTLQLVRDLEVATVTDESFTVMVSATSEVAETPTNVQPIMAPTMGTFFRAASPEAPPFVKEGDVIEVGQVIGLIEAMKTFNEIPSPVAGRVAAVLATNGQLVSPEDALLLVEPAEGGFEG